MSKRNRNYILAADTDTGITKATNQDSLFMRTVYHPNTGPIVLAVICDGMGGLQKGEVASAAVVNAFEQWLAQVKPETLLAQIDERWVYEEFNHIIQCQNQYIHDYGIANQINLGTTVSAFLLVNGIYYIVHVGDTRIYELTNTIIQLTEDQTLVAKELKEGLLTAKEVETDPRRNVLLQCVGASERVVPQYLTGSAILGAVYLLCSDGFRHQLTSEEIYQNLNANVLLDKGQAAGQLRYLIDLNKQRQEPDNITAATICT